MEMEELFLVGIIYGDGGAFLGGGYLWRWTSFSSHYQIPIGVGQDGCKKYER
jgi:hypothetical protein